jgi:hypothetical protein
MANQILPRLGATLVLGAAAAGLVAAGLAFRAADVTTPPAIEPGEISIPAAPPVSEAPPMATDAFTRPVFHANREPGPDKAPAVPADVATDPIDGEPAEPAEPGDAPAGDSFVLKGLIIGDRGARVALQAPSGGAPVWAKVGDEVEGWTVDSITSDRVRLRNGDEIAEIKLFKDK